MKIHLNALLIKSLVLVISFLLGVNSYAESWDETTDNEAEYSVTEQGNQQPTMAWSLLPGESLNDVARLFYPKNKQMQWRFVEKTVQLSREVYPNLNPAYHVDIEHAIVIPNIKYLKSPKVKKHFKPEYKTTLKSPESASQATPNETTAWQEAYDYLVAKNQFLKQEIAKLNAKLAYLQELLASLTADLLRVLDNTAPHSSKSPTQTIESTVEATLSPSSHAGVGFGRGSQNTWYLWLPILSVLFVMSLFFMLGLHKTSATVNNHYSPNLYAK